jgi:hypothetical protein
MLIGMKNMSNLKERPAARRYQDSISVIHTDGEGIPIGKR